MYNFKIIKRTAFLLKGMLKLLLMYYEECMTVSPVQASIYSALNFTVKITFIFKKRKKSKQFKINLILL